MFGVGVGIRVGGFTPSSGGGGLNPDAQAFITATGITNPTEISAINTLVNDLQGYGLWSKMKALYPFVTDNRNLLSYTEDFGNAVWVKVNATATTNTTTSPNGTLTADTYSTNTTTGAHVFVFPITLNTATYTYSIYAKKVNSRYISIKSTTSGTSWSAINVDLDTSTVTKIQDSTVSGTTASVVDVGNGWRRISMTFTNSASDIAISYSNSSNPTFDSNRGDILVAGTGTDNYYIWGAQLELGSTASTYQPIATTQQAFISNQFKYNLKNPVDSDAAFRLVFNGGWTFASTGATPNGTNAYGDTKCAPSQMAQNSIHMSYYSRSNIQQLGMMGASNTSTNNIIYLNPYYTNGQYYVHANNLDGSTYISSTETSSAAYFIIQRTTSTNNKYYKNGTLINSGVLTSATPSNNSIYVGAANLVGQVEYSSRQCAFASIGDGLLDTEASNLYSAVNTFQVALSRNV